MGDFALLFGLDVEQIEVVFLVLMRDPFAVGRGDGLPAKNGAAGGQRLSRPGTIGGHLPEFDLASGGAEREQSFAVGQHPGVAHAGGLGGGGLDKAPLTRGREEDPAARKQNQAGAIVVEARARVIFIRIADPAFAQVVEVGGEFDVELLVAVGGDVVEPEVGAALVHNPAALQRGGLDVPAGVFGVLAERAALLVHGPEVHGAARSEMK